MNNLFYLGSRDFSVDEAPKGKVLVNNQKGIMFCLFHADMNKCQYCMEAIPELKKLSLKMPGVKFGLCNLNRDQDVYYMSTQTIAPIERVPYMILYVQGRPLMSYDGEKRADAMMNFLGDVVSRLNNKKDFFEQKNYKMQSSVPTYSKSPQFNVICDDELGICYVDTDDAYNSKAAQRR